MHLELLFFGEYRLLQNSSFNLQWICKSINFYKKVGCLTIYINFATVNFCQSVI